MSAAQMNSDSPIKKKLETWKCGEPYQHPVKKPKIKDAKSKGDDPWEILFEDLIKEDEFQCETWKGEVDNLLVFAGLFSAVVTAFVIELYRTLSPDPNETIINVLSIIATRTGGANASDALPLPIISDPFQANFIPTKTSVRINIYFFLSLVLSLSAALIGIVCLQWLRQHRSYPNNLTAEQQFALLRMRTEALMRWKVNAIFAFLPLLLQAALVLFFIGLIELVWHLNHTVIIPVGVLIAIILLFLLLTTVLPTFQLFPLCYPRLQINDEIPVECPYKSPQAEAFRRLVTSSTVGFVICSGIVFPAFFIPLFIHLRYQQLVTSSLRTKMKKWWTSLQTKIKTSWTSSRPQKMTQTLWQHILTVNIVDVFFFLLPVKDKTVCAYSKGDSRKTLIKSWAEETWSSLDVQWMSIRDTYFRYKCNENSWLHTNKDDQENNHMKHYYDAILGLRKSMEDNISNEDESIILAAYHCAQYMPPSRTQLASTTVRGRDHPVVTLTARNHYLSKILRHSNGSSIAHLSDIIDQPTAELLIDENACIFLNFANAMGDRLRQRLSRPFAETQLRLLGYLYEKTPSHSSKLVKAPVFDPKWLKKPLIIQPVTLFFMNEMDDGKQPFIYQWACVVHSLFEYIVDKEVNLNTSTSEAFVAHPIFQSIITYFCKEIAYHDAGLTRTGHYSNLAVTKSIETVNFIKDSLQALLEPNNEDYWTSHPSHCLFYCASYYLKHLDEHNMARLSNIKQSIYPLLIQYKRRVGGLLIVSRKDRKTIIGGRMWDTEDADFELVFSAPWWSFLGDTGDENNENANEDHRVSEARSSHDEAERVDVPQEPAGNEPKMELNPNAALLV